MLRMFDIRIFVLRLEISTDIFSGCLQFLQDNGVLPYSTSRRFLSDFSIIILKGPVTWKHHRIKYETWQRDQSVEGYSNIIIITFKGYTMLCVRTFKIGETCLRIHHRTLNMDFVESVSSFEIYCCYYHQSSPLSTMCYDNIDQNHHNHSYLNWCLGSNTVVTKMLLNFLLSLLTVRYHELTLQYFESSQP
jgi:hypothetical protein